jgi:peptide/nickel transport system substrate-binding protein
MWVVHQLYNTLVEVDDSLNIIPSLAKSFSVQDGGMKMIFNLRTDVWFHNDPCFKGNSRKLTANDVVYSFKRIINPATASPGAWIFNDRVAAQDPFTAPDDSTFVLNLRSPFLPMLGILTMPYCSILPEEAVEFYGANFRSRPVGTGPFKFVNWIEGQALVCTRNERYFERDENGNRLPYLDGLFVNFFDSKATEFLQFRQKKIDFINDIDVSFKDEVLTRSGKLRDDWKNSANLNKHAYLNTEYLGILMDSSKAAGSPFQQKKIRQAMNFGIDRAKMMLYLRNSIGSPASSGFVPRGLPSFDENAGQYT